MIHIGTSGYSYDDWHGPFYPPDTQPRDRLAFYAQQFRCVEVNSTFYRQPAAAMTEALARKVPEDFRFALKVYGGITHDWTAATRADFAVYEEGCRPLIERGMLGAVLAQFPQSFQPTKPAVGHVRRLREMWRELPLAVEFRHRRWLDERAFELLRQDDIGFCCVDEPPLPDLMPATVKVTARLSYARFHGRNAEMWYEHEEAWQRYDYLYSPEELAEWVPRIKSLARDADEVYVFFNNHYEAQAATNARDLAAQLDMDLA